jgi:hypothetical protein
MPEIKLEYSEYQSVVDILGKSDQSNVYQDLMKKEEKTLDSVNKVIKYYKDNDYKSKEFLYMSFWELTIRFGEIWPELWSDITSSDPKNISFFNIFMKDDRPIYIGILLIIISVFLLFMMIVD